MVPPSRYLRKRQKHVVNARAREHCTPKATLGKGIWQSSWTASRLLRVAQARWIVATQNSGWVSSLHGEIRKRNAEES